mmetsp:Transcript_19885/g.79373  ORF Transcript_19885/g.79373 Transcript_19885/m.79373 type:complete len:131 (-) Transcript_19885:3414-3806(-)
MEKILDFSLPDKEFVALLDQVIQVLNTSQNGDEQKAAQAILTQFLETPDGWTRCDKILDDPGASSFAKFYGLQVLGEMVKYRWRTLPRETCESIRDYIVGKVRAREAWFQNYRMNNLVASKSPNAGCCRV